ncbi:hypothetical protein [Azohydromonas lata]|uniref:Uncharacterized protein n=1 Tax=Azohydromonas lata TaxID=45677 RepID=A0ABU5IR19_9BURK|nr:hypothetical protein [Azohydromonas lata]MDZ5461347.1 hypothetical protein [Azohydromonas lata]
MDAALLQEALGVAEAADTVRQAAAALRERYAPLRVIVVDAMDMRHEAPSATGTRRVLWLGASDGHCWTVTTDPAQAAGFYLADKG